MITRLTLVTILVRDQDEALQGFTEVLGLENVRMLLSGKEVDGWSLHHQDKAISGSFFRSPTRMCMGKRGRGKRASRLEKVQHGYSGRTIWTRPTSRQRARM
jgi:hypothetical protein